MILLVDRQTGELLGTVSEDDLEVLQDILEADGPSQTGYILQAGSLEFLAEAGLSLDALDLLQRSLAERSELLWGWERDHQGNLVVGRVLSDEDGQPLAGLRVRLGEPDSPLWTFTRPEGSFELRVTLKPQILAMEITGPADQELWSGHLEVVATPRLDLGDLRSARPSF